MLFYFWTWVSLACTTHTMHITLDPTVQSQLNELSRITNRPAGDLINDMCGYTLRQLIEQNDTDYLQAFLGK